MSYETALEEATQFSSSCRARFRSPADPGALAGLAGGGIALGGNAALAGVIGGDDRSAEQLQRFRGLVYAAVRPKALVIAGLRWRVGFEVQGKRGRRAIEAERLPTHLKAIAGELELYESHPLLDVLASPNELMTSWHLNYITAASLDLTGWTYWWIVPAKRTREGKESAAIWPIPPSWISPVHEENKPRTAWKISPGGSGAPIEVPAEQVVVFYTPDPANPLGAVGSLQATAKSVIADEQMLAANEAAFRNGIWSGLALIVGDITDEDEAAKGRPLLEGYQREQLKSAVVQHYASVVRAHEPLLLDALIQDVKQITNKPAEMDFLESSQFTYGRVTQGFGTNPFIMGSTENGNRAQSIVARQHMADFAVNPIVEMFGQTFTNHVHRTLSRRGERVHVWLEPYVPDDVEERRKDIALLLKEKAMDRQEARTLFPSLGLDLDKPGFDSILLPNNMLPAAVEGKATLKEPLMLAAPTDAKQERIDRWAKTQGRAEGELAEVVAELLAQQRESVIEALSEMFAKAVRQEGIADLVFHPSEWYEIWDEAIRPIAHNMMVEGAVREAAEVAKAQKQAEPEDVLILGKLDSEVLAGIETELNTIMSRPYWQEIHDTTKQQLAATLHEGFENGESLYEMSVRIGDSPTNPALAANPAAQAGVLGSESNVRRALNIARTESTGFLNAGHQAQMDQLQADGTIKGKEWATILDDFTRPEHWALDGTVISV
ncbi:MAG: phage portal protein, partial [Planctomycetota bacterium]